MAYLILTAWRIISMQAADWSIISENYKKQSYHQSKKIKKDCTFNRYNSKVIPSFNIRINLKKKKKSETV